MTKQTGVATYKNDKLTISQAKNGVKIKNDPAAGSNIVEALKYIFQLVGLKQWPDDKTDGAVLVQFILTEWKEITVEEMVLAFRLYTKGELDDCPELFQNFNGLYFSRIMQSYKRKKATENKNPQRKQYDKKKPSKEELKEICSEFLNECFLKPIENKGNLFNEPLIYRTLEMIGVINYTKKEKADIKTVAESEYMDSLNTGADMNEHRSNASIARRIIDSGMNKTDKEKIKALARKIALYKWLKKVDKESIRAIVENKINEHYS